MSVNAPGQLLGYSIQFPRALLRLLQAQKDDVVGIEVCGDVSVTTKNFIISEEDKSSIKSNPLSDKSKNLWKTFYNWRKAIEDGILKSNNTQFVLYCNYEQNKKSLVCLLSDSKTDVEIESVVEKCKQIFSSIEENKEIYKYIKYVLIDDEFTFKEIVKNFELVVNGKEQDVYDDLVRSIRSKFIEEERIGDVLHRLSGWLQQEINTKIAKQEPSVVHYNDFHNYCVKLCNQVRAKTLLDYAVNLHTNYLDYPSSGVDTPTYVKQLEIIKLDEVSIIEAISDFYRAATNRQKWIEMNILDEDSIKDFENRLISFYGNQKKINMITITDKSEEDMGKMLLYQCQQRIETINSITPPDRTIQGSYHALSEGKQIGWHPNWTTIINNISNG